GFVRELIIVGRLGVHDYTDAYFATSVVVLWAQNWSFGAWALYFVPKYLSLPNSLRRRWVRSRLASAALVSSLLEVCFVFLYPHLERLLLGGRTILGLGEAVALSLSLPATALGGVLYSRLIATPRGILLAARALLVGNAAGLTILVALLLSPI